MSESLMRTHEAEGSAEDEAKMELEAKAKLEALAESAKMVQNLLDQGYDYENALNLANISAETYHKYRLYELMRYFVNPDPNNMNFGALSEAVARIKNTREGVNSMSEKLEALIRTREAKKTVKVVRNLLKEGYNKKKALKLVGADAKTYKKYKAIIAKSKAKAKGGN